MTKKHFEIIARTLHKELAKAKVQSPETRAAVIHIIEALMYDFATFNPKFNAVRFYCVCGLYEE